MAAGSRSHLYNQKTQTLYVCKHGVWLLALLSLFQCCGASSVVSTRLTGYRPVEKYRGIDDDGVFNILGEFTFKLLHIEVLKFVDLCCIQVSRIYLL